MNRNLPALVATMLIASQAAVMADEVRSSSSTVSTPQGSASRSVTTKSDAAGTSTKVQNTNTNASGSASTSYSAKAGPNGAKVSATKTNVQANGDGSVSSTRTHESHAVNDAGAVHHKSAASTTVDADGSSTSVKQESTSAHP